MIKAGAKMDNYVKKNVKEFLEFLLCEVQTTEKDTVIEDIKRGLGQLEKDGILVPF